MNQFKMLIDGELVDSSLRMDVVNPANESIVANIPIASPDDVNRAVAGAKKAFEDWKSTSLEERRKCLTKLVSILDENSEELAEILTLEQGKTLADARNEVMFAGAFASHYLSADLEPEVLLEDETQRVEIHRRPLGVVAGITTWNFPLLIAVYKIAPAVITGNTIIIKTAPSTPLATLKFGELIKDCFPDGVINIIADNNDVGPLLTSHPDVQKVSFTGSTATGRKIMASAAPTLKRLTLELGGNDAAIVLGDVDVDKVAESLFGVSFMNSGQVCICLKRMYVHESIYEELCERIAALANAANVGDGMDPGNQFGPIQNKAQYEKVLDFLEDAKTKGTVIAGGTIDNKPGFNFPLTVIKDISEGAKMVDEEAFGPILPIIKFSDVDDAIRRANASEQGLGASVWSSDLDKAHEVALQLEAGTVWVNKHLDFGPHIPFPPAKQSGVGVEWGKEGMLEFTAMQVVNINKA
ncbi:MAG: acyl-CoA reductase-like NAD-dependent aldehyde dehydrogenase [Neolewinella sp.]|jgi:acyl-CoA reductase-like NAD-dependent aldehyde dehydrogenase